MAEIDEHEVPEQGSKPLSFDTLYAQPITTQYVVLVTLFLRTFWRTPSYNGTRFFITLGIALAFAAMYWKDCNKR